MSPNHSASAVNDTLERHQLRREQGLPTLTLLVGPAPLAARCWRDWAELPQLAVMGSCAGDEEALAQNFLEYVANSGDLVNDALTWLATHEDEPDFLPRSRFNGMTLHDFDILWRSLCLDLSHNPVACVVHRILRAAILGHRVTDNPAASLSFGNDPQQQLSAQVIFVGLAGMIHAACLPAIIVTAPAEKPPGWLDRAAKVLAELVAAVPCLPMALVATGAEVDEFLRANPDSRLTTLLREGRVDLEGLQSAETGDQPVTITAETSAALAQVGVTPRLTALLGDAVGKLADDGDRADEDRARSAAERFLFEVLESWGVTTGKFKLNERLEFLHGSSRAEGDLVAAACRLVIELDGGYHHLGDVDAYRRDRSKDYKYQRHGYLVLRFLSEDVVTQLDKILQTIGEALEHQTRSAIARRLDR